MNLEMLKKKSSYQAELDITPELVKELSQKAPAEIIE